MAGDAARARPRIRLPWPLALAFGASGFAALVDEVAASRYLAIPFGADAPALAAVLSALLVGFAAGGAAAGWWLARGADARRLALAVELGLAGCALLAPVTMPSLAPVIELGARAFEIDSAGFVLFRFALALAVCLPAALLMGATFPVALRLARAERLEESAAPSAVYAPNTLGAAAGALVAGFVLLPALGYPGTFAVAACANALSFACLWRWARPSSARDEAPVVNQAPPRRSALAATFVAGFAAFALEVLLARAAITVFGASTYATTAVLVAFLLGLSLGAPIGARAKDPRRALAFALAAAAALAFLGLLGFQLYLGLDDPFRATNLFPELLDPRLLPLYQAMVAMLLLLPPALAFGAAFPLAVAAARPHGASPDRAAGLVYAANTLGCLAGTLCGTFVLMPAIGPRAGVAVALALLVVTALALARSRAVLAASGAATALGAIAFAAARGGGTPGAETLFFHEGVASTVAVEKSLEADGLPIRSISVNGTVVATESLLDLRLQRLLGHLPALLHPAPKKTLVVGLGSGVTAGALATSPGVEVTQIVELERSVVDAARLFASTNRGVASGEIPGVRITIADGRTHLLTTAHRYDVLTSDPIHPWVAGAGNLYARECFEQVRSRMAPGAIAALWLPLYKLRTEDLRTIAATWTSVFRPSALYLTGYDTILLGADGAFPQLSIEELRRRFAAIEGSLTSVEVRSVEELLSGFVMDDAALRAFAADAPKNTDSKPILEYRAPLLYLSSYATDFLRDIARRTVDPAALFGAGARVDAEALERAVDRRARAVERFLATSPSSVKRGVAEAAAVLRESRAPR